MPVSSICKQKANHSPLLLLPNTAPKIPNPDLLMGAEVKARGNRKYTDGYAGAIRHLSYVFLQKYKDGDANKSVKLKPDWYHGYGGLGQYNDAVWAYKKGLEIFWPETWVRLTADPATRVYLQQPDFLKMMHDIHRDYSNLNLYLKDPRVMQACYLLLKGSPTDMPQPEVEERSADPEVESTEAEAEGAMAFHADKHISYLKVSSTSELLKLPSTLESLTIIGCHYLLSLQHVPIKKCISLSELSIIDCCSLRYFADYGWYPSSLTTLSVLDCGKLEFLLTVKQMPNLKHLFLGNSCHSLKSFPLNLFPKLRFLTIQDCPNLESFSISMDGCHNNNLSLESLTIRCCPKLVSFPTEGLLSPRLQSLSLSNCENLRSLPNHMTTLTSLQSLLIEKCPELESLPAGGLPSSLTFLSIAFCDKLTPQKEWNLRSLHCLSHFMLHGGCRGLNSFPEKDLLPINLNSLYISELPDLWVLDHIGFQQLTALESLEINCCKKLWLFPKPLPPSLTSLCIKESSKLSPKLLNKESEDWRKINHISRIQIDDSVISRNDTGAPFVSNSWIPISTIT